MSATTTTAAPVVDLRPDIDGTPNWVVEHPHGPAVVAVEHDVARVAVYLHHPADGGAPYLVVDIDSVDDEPQLRVYVNDAPATLPGFRVVTA